MTKIPTVGSASGIIKGHHKVGSTDCPGKNLFALLYTLVIKANRYRYSESEKDQPSVQVVEKEVILLILVKFVIGA